MNCTMTTESSRDIALKMLRKLSVDDDSLSDSLTAVFMYAERLLELALNAVNDDKEDALTREASKYLIDLCQDLDSLE